MALLTSFSGLLLWRRAMFAVAGLMALGLISAAHAAEQREVQAVFLLNLSRFVRWPETAFATEEAPLVIGFMADEALGALLAEAAHNEKSGRHPIEVRPIRTFADLEGCHIAYFSRAEATAVPQFIAQLRAKSVLMVSDADGFLRLGGHVQLYQRGGQFKLRIDVGNLKRSELSASAPLLRVAEVFGDRE